MFGWGRLHQYGSLNVGDIAAAHGCLSWLQSSISSAPLKTRGASRYLSVTHSRIESAGRKRSRRRQPHPQSRTGVLGRERETKEGHTAPGACRGWSCLSVVFSKGSKIIPWFTYNSVDKHWTALCFIYYLFIIYSLIYVICIICLWQQYLNV